MQREFPSITAERLKQLRSSIRVLKRDLISGQLHELDETKINAWKDDITAPGRLGAKVSTMYQFYALPVWFYLPPRHFPEVTIEELFAQFDHKVATMGASPYVSRTVAAIELWHKLVLNPKDNRTDASVLLYHSAR